MCISKWKNGWFGIQIAIDSDEINRLIELLRMIQQDPNQHFHISSDWKGTGGVGNIEISLRWAEQEHNMHLTSRAYLPGERIKE